MPEDVKKAALEEAKKLESAGRDGMEQNVIRNYLDFLLALPWAAEEAKNIDLPHAREILNARHYGLDKVKDRIIQHLAVMRRSSTRNRITALPTTIWICRMICPMYSSSQRQTHWRGFRLRFLTVWR